MEVYLDNSATTKPYKEVVDEMVNALTVNFYNPSSAYREAIIVEKKIREIRKNIAKTVGTDEKNIIFTSGGTEANNSVLRGAVKWFKNRRNEIITTDIEHPAVLRTVEDLSDNGAKSIILKVGENGLVNLDDLKNSLSKNTSIVSVMYVNNEIGVVEPIKEISKIIKDFDSEILFHVDAVQGYGKINFKVDDLGVDFLTVSAHKIHGPKGVGFMYIRDTKKFTPFITGGGQESNLRSGTENVPGIYGLGAAVNKLFSDVDGVISDIEKKRNYLYEKIKSEIDDIRVNTPLDSAVCHILNISFMGVRGEVLLHYLEQDGIYVSTGSACSTKKKGSHVLNAIGLNKDEIDGAIRFSLSENITYDEIDFVVDKLKEYVESIRLLSRYKKKR